MKDRFRQRDRGHELVAQLHHDRVAAGRGLRRDPWLTATRQDQQAALGPRLLNGGPQDRVDQLFKDDLPRDGLRHFDHGGEIKLFDRRSDRPLRAGCWLVLSQVGIQCIELPHLAISAPTQVAVPGVSQVEAWESGQSHAPRRSALRSSEAIASLWTKPLSRAERMACS